MVLRAWSREIMILGWRVFHGAAALVYQRVCKFTPSCLRPLREPKGAFVPPKVVVVGWHIP